MEPTKYMTTINTRKLSGTHRIFISMQQEKSYNVDIINFNRTQNPYNQSFEPLQATNSLLL